MQDHTNDPTWKQAVAGSQMLLVAFGALVLMPLITGLDPNVALFTAGLGTLIFHIVTGGQIPIFLASSFAFIAPVIAAKSKFGLEETLGGLMAAGEREEVCPCDGSGAAAPPAVPTIPGGDGATAATTAAHLGPPAPSAAAAAAAEAGTEDRVLLAAGLHLLLGPSCDGEDEAEESGFPRASSAPAPKARRRPRSMPRARRR